MPPRKLIDNQPTVDAAAARINLRHLQAFAAVAAHGSVTRAAESLFRVASAITRAVAELEESLGTPLFERKARGMLLNAFGEAVQARRSASRMNSPPPALNSLPRSLCHAVPMRRGSVPGP